MAQFEHSITRRKDFVTIFDGRGTTTMLWDEFVQFALCVSTVANGADSSCTQEYEAREAWYRDQRSPSTIAARAQTLLAAIGLGQTKQRYPLLKGKVISQ